MKNIIKTIAVLVSASLISVVAKAGELSVTGSAKASYSIASSDGVNADLQRGKGLGVTNEFSEKGFISIKNNKIDGTTQFKIIVADYGIEIPKIVRNNIAKIVDVNVKLSLKKK